jgi:hypothetical protein
MELQSKVLQAKELRSAVCKEQNGARPVWAEASSGVTELGRDVRKKVGGERTLVTKIPEMERKKQLATSN